ncbi:S-layer homology domain-containing protein [Microbacterium sp. zg.Y909]|uniref:S-layer homology domain-containing protein n=1 Tax=Microbacterium sp. zg.Y909 TaxID=2969413 RepID=UPI00214AD493|nr:S-layer homology domain-containing protein [Microbacterium sp. zg.Y909]MCR2823994.1 S-layer homology domain-containing protein [Microbacterium sp. zg.Y909]
MRAAVGALLSLALVGPLSAAPAAADPVGGNAHVSAVPAIAEDTRLDFTDVGEGTAFYTEIMWLADSGVTSGWADGTFRPYQPVTRDAMAAFLYRLDGSPSYTPPSVSPFVDVPTSYQFYKEISWLAEQGITTGWDTAAGREYRPWNLITRDAMAAFLYRYDGSPSFEPSAASPFRDVSATSSFYREILWLASRGISTGWDVGNGCRDYRPFGNVARDAMAAFMYRSVNGGTSPVVGGTCSPPPPGPVVSDPVTPGAFCAKELAGWYGRSAQGVLMQCATAPHDSRLRWRAV